MTAQSNAFALPPRRRAERLSVAVVTELVERRLFPELY